jgi:chemotaxis protein methyltransferase CheR
VTRESHVRWPDPSYASLEATIRKRSGLIFQAMRRDALELAANRVMKRVGLNSADAFLPLLQQDGGVFDDLMAEVTIGETYFFREPAHFSLLRKTILPQFRARARPEQKFRAWSAACATGEEPYSIALALREEGVPSAVLGTDIARARLGAARRGEYRQWSFRGVADAMIQRNFRQDGDTFILGSDVRRDVEFRYLNLASDSYPSMSSGVWGMDLVLCRNVLIYFDRDTIARVAASLLASVGDEGWLLLGATDPPLNDFVQCEVIQTDAGLAYRHYRGTKHRSIASVTAAPPLPRVPVAPIMADVPSITADVWVAPAPRPVVASVPPTRASADLTPAQAYADRDYERTIALVAPALTAGSATAADLVVHVRALANLGQLEQAGRACAAALDQFRDVPELHYLHAVLVAQAGSLAESARAAKRAIYLDRTLVVAHLALGSALAGTGDADGAGRAFAASERLLSAMPPEALVPGTDGEPAGRLLEMSRMQAKLVRREDAA